MKTDIIKFFTIQRQIFGVCPHSGQFFRLSDCKIYRKTKPTHDWMDKLESEDARLDGIEERIEDKKEEIKAKAQKKGREEANRHVKKIDRVFTPRKINPDDAKVLFHPIDYVVFNGMKNNEMKNLLLLDRQTKSADHRRLQNSIEKTIERGNFEWVTLRVEDNGEIKEE
jgi:predicted Holliday junction resolvase-like endonuclease